MTHGMDYKNKIYVKNKESSGKISFLETRTFLTNTEKPDNAKVLPTENRLGTSDLVALWYLL